MKTGIIMFFTCVWMASASVSFSQEKTIPLKTTGGTLKELCDEIERNSDYRFIFSGDVSKKMNTTLNIGATDGTIAEILKTLSEKAGVSYNIYGKQVVLFDTPAEETLKKTADALQPPPPPKKEFVSLKGTVTDEKGESLPGVSIYIPASTMGVTSDIDGKFDFPLPAGESMVILFDFVGMKTHEHLFMGAPETIEVVMKSDDEMLDEVVVIGYGSKDRKSLTSAVSSMKNETVEQLAKTATSVDNMLGGNLKGVFSSQVSGEPGVGASINIRGKTSMPSWGKTQTNTPLYIIDGLPIFMEDNMLNPLLSLSPNDIESIDVLKDASATAIYGSRGANGVIIVKTKAGRKGDGVSVEAGYSFSVGNPIKEHKPLNIAEFKQLHDEVFKTSVHFLNETKGVLPRDYYKYAYSPFGRFEVADDPEGGGHLVKKYMGLNEKGFGTNYINWQEAIKNRNAATHQYNVSIRGGSEFSNYSLSINATDQQGLLINDRLKRYSGRLSIDTEIIPGIVQAGGTSNFAHSARKGGIEDRGVFQQSTWRIRPDVPVYDKEENFLPLDNSPQTLRKTFAANPVAERQKRAELINLSFSGNTYLSVRLMKGLTVRTDLSVASHLFTNNLFTPSFSTEWDSTTPPVATFKKADDRSTYTSLNLRADYTANWGAHGFTAMLGAGSDRSFHHSFSQTATGFVNEVSLDNFTSGKTFSPPSEGKSVSGLNSFYSRLSYDYDSRYLAEMSFRADESSKFGPGNRVAYFPALSLGWRINNESFLKESDKVDDLKLRFSLGKTGSTNVDDFTFLQYYQKKNNYGGDVAFGLTGALANRNIGWEKTSEINAGIDFSFFDTRLRGSLDVYRRVTKGVLTDSPFLPESGRESFTANLTDLSNRGFEFEIGGDIIRIPDFTWQTSLNVSTNRSRVDKLHGASFNPAMQDVIVEGQPMGVVKGFRVIKMLQKEDMKKVEELNENAIAKGGKDKNGTNIVRHYQSKDLSPGDFLLADINGNGRIDPGDRVVIANPEPKFFGGWSNTFTYKNLSLALLMQFSQGGEAIYTEIGNDLAVRTGQGISRETFGRTWTLENTNAPYPKIVVAPRSENYNPMANDRYVFKTSFLRMRDVTLSYNLGEKMTDALMLQNLLLYTSVTNLFTITRWPGVDPELVGTGIYSAGGGFLGGENPYPFARTVTVGARITF